MAVNDDRAVDRCAEDGVAQAVEVNLERCSRVADGDPLVDEAGEGLLGQFNDLGEGHDFGNLNLRLLLVDVDDLDLAAVGFGPSYKMEL